MSDFSRSPCPRRGPPRRAVWGCAWVSCPRLSFEPLVGAGGRPRPSSHTVATWPGETRRHAEGGQVSSCSRHPPPTRETDDQSKEVEQHDWTHRPDGRGEGRDGPTQRPAARLRPGAHRQGRPRGALPAHRDGRRRQLHRLVLRGLPLRTVPPTPPEAVPPQRGRPHRHRARRGRHPRRRRQHREHARRVEATGRRSSCCSKRSTVAPCSPAAAQGDCAGSKAAPPTPTAPPFSCSTRVSA